jgi:hypothetical protein
VQLEDVLEIERLSLAVAGGAAAGAVVPGGTVAVDGGLLI